MNVEHCIKSLFTLRNPRIAVSPKNFEHLRDNGYQKRTPDDSGAIHVPTNVGFVAVHANQDTADDQMLIWFCDGISWNCPLSLWEDT